MDISSNLYRSIAFVASTFNFQFKLGPVSTSLTDVPEIKRPNRDSKKWHEWVSRYSHKYTTFERRLRCG